MHCKLGKPINIISFLSEINGLLSRRLSLLVTQVFSLRLTVTYLCKKTGVINIKDNNYAVICESGLCTLFCSITRSQKLRAW